MTRSRIDCVPVGCVPLRKLVGVGFDSGIEAKSESRAKFEEDGDGSLV